MSRDSLEEIRKKKFRISRGGNSQIDLGDTAQDDGQRIENSQARPSRPRSDKKLPAMSRAKRFSEPKRSSEKPVVEGDTQTRSKHFRVRKSGNSDPTKGATPRKAEHTHDGSNNSSKSSATQIARAQEEIPAGETPKSEQEVAKDLVASSVAAPTQGSMRQEIQQIQNDIERRRRIRRLKFIFRLVMFIFIPTAFCSYYFVALATPLYSARSVFEVQQATVTNSSPSGLFGQTGAVNQDAVAVQEYVTSLEAMIRLNHENDFAGHLSVATIDWIQRLRSDASTGDLFKKYRGVVEVGFDSADGVIRMEVSAHDPRKAVEFSSALISFARERLNERTRDSRTDFLSHAEQTYRDAELRMVEAQDSVLELQRSVGVLDPTEESALLLQQITSFEAERSRKSLELEKLLSNDQPNAARVDAVRLEIERLDQLVLDLRAGLTATTDNSVSLAETAARLQIATTDLQTRSELATEALRSLEAARIEAQRANRYISVSVNPVASDDYAYPRELHHSTVALAVFCAIHLFSSITISILGEQLK